MPLIEDRSQPPDGGGQQGQLPCCGWQVRPNRAVATKAVFLPWVRGGQAGVPHPGDEPVLPSSSFEHPAAELSGDDSPGFAAHGARERMFCVSAY